MLLLCLCQCRHAALEPGSCIIHAASAGASPNASRVGELGTGAFASRASSFTEQSVQCSDADHLFYKVGLTPCELATASASLGTTIVIPFSVYDDGSPQLKATVNRTILVVSPCSAGMPYAACALTTVLS